MFTPPVWEVDGGDDIFKLRYLLFVNAVEPLSAFMISLADAIDPLAPPLAIAEAVLLDRLLVSC